MSAASRIRQALSVLAVGAGAAGAAYAAYAAVTWLNYGRAMRHRQSDPLLDHFMPEFEEGGRHSVRVAAPAEVTLAAAKELDLTGSAAVRALFKSREVVMGASPQERELPREFMAMAQALGWGMLGEIPGREIAMGAVTQPWEADVKFRALPPEKFAGFSEPGWVKIAWTLRADPLGERESVFITETRVATTDETARAKFRVYWSVFSPGIILLRVITKRLLKAEAERRARAGGA